MKILSTAASVVALVIASPGLATAQVSVAGARDVQTTFESYFGKGSDGVSAVRVTTNAANDGYDVSIDVARLAKPLEMAGVTVKPALVGFVVKPNADGTWAYSQTSFPTLAVTAPNGNKVEIGMNGLSIAGTFDPKLAALTAYSGTVKSVTSRNEDASTKASAETQDIKISGTSTDAGGGLVDGQGSYVTGSFAETIASANGTGAPIRISFADSTSSATVSGQAAKATLDLWSYLVAHPSKAALTADQAALKAKILATLPFFKRVSAATAVNNLIVETPLGNTRIAKLGLTETVNGIVPEGLLEIGLSIGAIEPPPALTPPWAGALIPKDSALGFRLTGYDLERFVRAVVAKLDLNDPKASELSTDETVATLVPSGKLTVDLTPAKFTNDLYTLGWTGKVEIDPKTSFVSGKATVTAKGLDKVAQLLSKQTDTVQYATMLFAAKAMAKPVDGNDVWELEFDSAGGFSVNGQKLGG